MARRGARRAAVAVVVVLAGGPLAERAFARQDCSRGSLGQLALDDLVEGDYLGVEGGLYPGGTNDIPTEHLETGRRIAKKITPLAADGTPASDGVIGVISIGMSFTLGVFDAFLLAAKDDPEFDPALRFVNGAAPHQNLSVIRDPTVDYWTKTLPDKLRAGGLTAAQVQVIWMLEGVDDPIGPFPDHYLTEADWWVEVLQILHDTFPNLQQCYLTSPQFQGFSLYPKVEEPYYFEQGFSVREVIARQLAGDPALAFDPELGPTEACWVAWGPYLWCDGVEPRVDGLRMACSDYRPDGSHLGDDGNAKLAARLEHFLKSHRACTRWSVTSGTSPAERMAAVTRIGDGTLGSAGQPRVCGEAPPTVPFDTPYQFLIRDSVANGTGILLLGTELRADGGLPFAGGLLYLVPLVELPVTLDRRGNAAIPLTEIPDDPALWDACYFAQFVALDPAGADGNFALSAAIELQLGD